MSDYICVFLYGFVSGLLPAVLLLIVRCFCHSVHLVEEG